MDWEKQQYGNTNDGAEASLFVCANGKGTRVGVSDYGATLVSVELADRVGDVQEVTLGFDDLAGYLGDHPFFGAIVGRYANRIAGARFELDGAAYPLYANDGINHLHGGKIGFNRVMWRTEVGSAKGEASIAFIRRSPDGEEGYPGNLDVTVTYILTDTNELIIEYRAQTDKATPVNLTNHAYWNLAGPGVEVTGHELQIVSSRRLSVSEALIPDGKIIDIDGGTYDFQIRRPLSRDYAVVGGYDDCFVVDGKAGSLRPAAQVYDPTTGRTMTIETNQPAIQLYTAKMLGETTGRGGTVYKSHGAICLETGAYNNAVNIPGFPSSILRPGEVYEHRTVHRFGTE